MSKYSVRYQTGRVSSLHYARSTRLCFLKGDAHAFTAGARRHKLQRFFRLADIADVYFQAAKQGRQAMHYEDAADDDLRRKLYTRSVSAWDMKLGWDITETARV